MASSSHQFWDVGPLSSAPPDKGPKPMRVVKFVVAAGAASLLSSVVFAADLPAPPPYAPPPPADFGGWYLRGDIGFSNQRVKDVSINDPVALAGVVPGTDREI